MPELPEVQCFVNALNTRYAGKKISKLYLRRGDLREPFDAKGLEQIFCNGARLERFERVGKQIVIVTDQGKVCVSLGMSGSFQPADVKHPLKHEHVTLEFGRNEALGFVDPRRFGFWRCGEPPAEVADPLSTKSLQQLFHDERVRKSTRSIKDLLLDQNKIGGVGNIYAIESLFDAGIRPTRVCARVSENEWTALAYALPPILKRAIELGGSTISSYRNLHGAEGAAQSAHKVYGREGERCVRKGCDGVVKRVSQGGRGSWYCPRCQR